ncbi:hypothetical protein PIB30_015116 [Stylosanthes scabra]|uniref:RRM domain-containing protein n=1 Tax=Stylosanthes scabra TaxID=79078 RepID=A0ABU6R792_9FABA|nr:hypothetical protein [Stylosanthes scabra]
MFAILPAIWSALSNLYNVSSYPLRRYQYCSIDKRSTLDKCRLPVGIRLFVSAGHLRRASESLKKGFSGRELGYVERVTHSEAAGLAGRRHKGESEGVCFRSRRKGSSYGVDEADRDNWKWTQMEKKSHTVFVDGLPHDIAKLTLFRIFGWIGGVVDIYVSRKKRRGSNMPFAFAEGKRKVERKVMEARHLARLYSSDGDTKMENLVDRRKKCIKVQDDPKQVDIMERSIIAECINTIRFAWVKEQIAEVWEGPGEVSCRDLGPFKCLLTFESLEAKNIAMDSTSLQSLFFELRPHWGFPRTQSRWIWLEITSVPVHAWSAETFMNIGKLWGKPVMMDELTDYYLSYTCASILVDSYEWEFIHEWVLLDDGERKFEVYVNEFGREMYNAKPIRRFVMRIAHVRGLPSAAM